MAGKYEENVGIGGCTRITCKANVTNTNTEALWKARAKEGGWFVKKSGTVPPAGFEYITVTFLADGDADILGRLDDARGTGDNFVVGIELVGIDGNAQGSATGALVAADKQVQGATGGKLKTVASGGFGAVYGGDKADLRLAWNSLGKL